MSHSIGSHAHSWIKWYCRPHTVFLDYPSLIVCQWTTMQVVQMIKLLRDADFSHEHRGHWSLWLPSVSLTAISGYCMTLLPQWQCIYPIATLHFMTLYNFNLFILLLCPIDFIIDAWFIIARCWYQCKLEVHNLHEFAVMIVAILNMIPPPMFFGSKWSGDVLFCNVLDLSSSTFASNFWRS